jgi:hypothetical protein
MEESFLRLPQDRCNLGSTNLQVSTTVSLAVTPLSNKVNRLLNRHLRRRHRHLNTCPPSVPGHTLLKSSGRSPDNLTRFALGREGSTPRCNSPESGTCPNIYSPARWIICPRETILLVFTLQDCLGTGNEAFAVFSVKVGNVTRTTSVLNVAHDRPVVARTVPPSRADSRCQARPVTYES